MRIHSGRLAILGMNTFEVILLSGFVAVFAMAALPRLSDSRLLADAAHAKRDLAAIAQAMEAYRLDNAGYPPNQMHSPLPFAPYRSEIDKRILTTPVSYLEQVPGDVFAAGLISFDPTYRVYAIAYVPRAETPYYYRNYDTYPKTHWMGWSMGPDQLANTDGYRTLPRIIQNESTTPSYIGVDRNGFWIGAYGNYYGMRYDPTNGALSYGDIYRFQSDAMNRVN